MENFSKKMEVAANVAIVVVAVLLSAVLVRSYLAAPSEREEVLPPVQTQRTIQSGEPVNLPGIDWQKNGRTLLMALSTTCHFCTESGPFYQRISQKRGGTSLVALFPQELGESQQYLKGLGVEVDEIRQAALGDFGLRGTPTLILVDERGRVVNTWVGMLGPEMENDVFGQLGSERAGM
jgi:hypothetical protein